ncbi:hypothetical protein [Streptomyces sp. NPDC002644]
MPHNLLDLPDTIPTVTLHGQYVHIDGRPFTGAIEIAAPSPLTFPDVDMFISGSIVVPLNAEGSFAVTLPATDTEGTNPKDWAYTITERLHGTVDRKSYQIKLPSFPAEVSLVDIAPSDPSTPNYVPVTGLDTHVFTGTAAPTDELGDEGDVYIQMEPFTVLGKTDTRLVVWRRQFAVWTKTSGDIRAGRWHVTNAPTNSDTVPLGDILLRADTGDVYQRNAAGWGSPIGNLKGPKGDTGAIGPAGPQGPQGPKGDPGSGSVNSVNGDLGPEIILDAADVGALPVSEKGAAGGVASLDTNGKLLAVQKPLYVASEIGALAATEKGAASGVATLDANGKLTTTQKPAYTAAEVGAQATGTAVLLSGAQTIAGTKTFSSAPVLPNGVNITGGHGHFQASWKTADTSRSNTATSAIDSDMQLPVAANGVYDIEVVAVWTHGGGGFRCDFSAPSGAAMAYTDNDGFGLANLGTDSTFNATSGTSFKGLLRVGSTAGNVSFRWAQNTSNAAATVLKAGSFIKAVRLD